MATLRPECPYMQGKCAAYDATNPYPKGSPEYAEWERGWADGDDEK